MCVCVCVCVCVYSQVLFSAILLWRNRSRGVPKRPLLSQGRHTHRGQVQLEADGSSGWSAAAVSRRGQYLPLSIWSQQRHWSCSWWTRCVIKRSINQSINQSVSQPTKQVNKEQSSNHSNNHSINRLISPSTNQPIDQAPKNIGNSFLNQVINQSINQWISSPIYRPRIQPAGISQ